MMSWPIALARDLSCPKFFGKENRLENIFLNRNRVPFLNPEGGLNRINITECESDELGRLQHPIIKGGYKNLRDLLREALTFSDESVLDIYSSDAITFFDVEFAPGVISRIDFLEYKLRGIISSQSVPFAVCKPDAIMGDVFNGEHCFPNTFKIEDDYILMGSNAHPNHPRDKKLKSHITIYFCLKTNNMWQSVLYDSLSEFSERNYRMAVVLLFSAIDICTQCLVKDEINKVGERLLNLKVKPRIKKKFEKKIAEVRRDVIHDYAPVSAEDARLAYVTAFDVLWELSEIS